VIIFDKEQIIMIDSIFLPPIVHLSIGFLVLLSNSVILVVTGWLALKKRAFTPLANFLFIMFQTFLMLQAMVGIKLLDQGMGVLQLYIHYLGGLAPLAFCLIFYWFFSGQNAVTKSHRLALISGISLAFVVLTFAVGSMYVAGGL
jgi:hypothetical protein